jgi:hypothetical protein
MPGPAQELATVTIRFASGQVADVTAQRLHYYADEAGRPVPGSGRYEDTPVPLDDPALVALLGEVTTGLIARVAEAEARVADLEAQLAADPA